VPVFLPSARLHRARDQWSRSSPMLEGKPPRFPPETPVRQSRRRGVTFLTPIIICSNSASGHVANRFEMAPVVEPADPFERDKLNGLNISPRTAATDHLGLLEADDRFGESVALGNRPTLRCSGSTGTGWIQSVIATL
jgi:hypothetical protein